jgi:membrane protease YdiL (CAAX protease family)
LRPDKRPTLIGLTLSLAGPGVIAFASTRAVTPATPLATRSLWLLLFIALVAAVAAIATRAEKLSWSELGFGRFSKTFTPLCAIILTLLFVLVFGPLAATALTKLGLGTFNTGQSQLAGLPKWYLALAIVIVASAEEWLYRAYAIERLQALTGSARLAGTISLLAFALVHVPMWGIGPSLATLVSGAILTLSYIWRRDIVALILAHVATDLWGLLL